MKWRVKSASGVYRRARFFLLEALTNLHLFAGA
jgi:hypothetical protein